MNCCPPHCMACTLPKACKDQPTAQHFGINQLLSILVQVKTTEFHTKNPSANPFQATRYQGIKQLKGDLESAIKMNVAHSPLRPENNALYWHSQRMQLVDLVVSLHLWRFLGVRFKIDKTSSTCDGKISLPLNTEERNMDARGPPNLQSPKYPKKPTENFGYGSFLTGRSVIRSR